MTRDCRAADSAGKLTRNEDLIFGVLSQTVAPMGAYAILDALRSQGFRSALQVYRALGKLIVRGLAHRVESLNAYVLCAHHGHEPHPAAFAICDKCGDVTEFREEAVERKLDAWARRNGFHRHASNVELRGLCGPCAHG